MDILDLDINALRAEIRQKFELIIPENDPIFLAAFLSDAVISKAYYNFIENQKLMNVQLISQRNVLIDQEKQDAQNLITKITKYSTDYFNKKIKEYADDQINEIKVEFSKIDQIVNKSMAANDTMIEKIQTLKNTGLFLGALFGASLLSNFLLLGLLILK